MVGTKNINIVSKFDTFRRFYVVVNVCLFEIIDILVCQFLPIALSSTLGLGLDFGLRLIN